MIERGDWQVSDIARLAFDLEGKVVGTIGAGRIGYRVLQRLVPFDTKELLYFDYAALPESAAKAVNARRVENLQVSFLSMGFLCTHVLTFCDRNLFLRYVERRHYDQDDRCPKVRTF